MWKLVAEDHERLALCATCDAEWRLGASDRADDDGDYYRLLQLQLRLAGEVWQTETGSYWFREPRVRVATRGA